MDKRHLPAKRKEFEAELLRLMAGPGAPNREEPTHAIRAVHRVRNEHRWSPHMRCDRLSLHGGSRMRYPSSTDLWRGAAGNSVLRANDSFFLLRSPDMGTLLFFRGRSASVPVYVGWILRASHRRANRPPPNFPRPERTATAGSTSEPHRASLVVELLR